MQPYPERQPLRSRFFLWLPSCFLFAKNSGLNQLQIQEACERDDNFHVVADALLEAMESPLLDGASPSAAAQYGTVLLPERHALSTFQVPAVVSYDPP